eukprot:Protomagalhaensia_wolfi_Nauph_80__3057@NODE_312_length_2811_cov_54_823232_g235_i0_p1_GENE_NODE_312_length_2811_cov_54_823232_g235_i0NODE_312_length_2811_cov_54_823232_g235_i0_p1_ORF_typecomplete_len388_score57_99Ogr_Delta/PF04606_12/0_051Ogr_Delta/PF04606_12/9e02CEBP_ZZ/PF16366_5/5_9CEBP_ZZ/PF16366_5/14_NODE_312_length_2811_cov_54_823232_g235_i05011664
MPPPQSKEPETDAAVAARMVDGRPFSTDWEAALFILLDAGVPLKRFIDHAIATKELVATPKHNLPEKAYWKYLIFKDHSVEQVATAFKGPSNTNAPPAGGGGGGGEVKHHDRKRSHEDEGSETQSEASSGGRRRRPTAVVAPVVSRPTTKPKRRRISSEENIPNASVTSDSSAAAEDSSVEEGEENKKRPSTSNQLPPKSDNQPPTIAKESPEYANKTICHACNKKGVRTLLGSRTKTGSDQTRKVYYYCRNNNCPRGLAKKYIGWAVEPLGGQKDEPSPSSSPAAPGEKQEQMQQIDITASFRNRPAIDILRSMEKLKPFENGRTQCRNCGKQGVEIINEDVSIFMCNQEECIGKCQQPLDRIIGWGVKKSSCRRGSFSSAVVKDS